jgi:RNA polymerase-binding transcription factor DksA
MNTNTYKDKLEQELSELESELQSVGRVNPENPGDWEPRPADQDILASDPNELGDKFDQYEENTAILKPLEIRYNKIKSALQKIESGSGFGVCEICGKEIESDRLGADPAAPTCKADME